MKTINFNEIKNLNINPNQCYEWIDEVLRNRDKYVMPTKTRIPFRDSDYFNIMPCILPEDNIMGLKVITRNEKRRNENKLNLDAQIFLYSYDNCELLSVMDGNYITTLRTAAVAVHSFLNTVFEYKKVALLGLGNIGTAIGDILFEKTKDKAYTIKLYKYKDHAERFMKRYEGKYKNITFEVCSDYESLMKDSDVIISSVTFASEDFCDPSVYKPGCTIIPVHMRGFMGCDLEFDHIIASDLERVKHFEYFDSFKKLSLTDDVLFNNKPVRNNPTDRVIIYNLGLAITDLYFSSRIYQLFKDKNDDYELGPDNSFYM